MSSSDDVAKALRLVEIDKRYVLAMPNTLPGQASEAVVRTFESIKTEYEALIAARTRYLLRAHREVLSRPTAQTPSSFLSS